MGKKKEDETMIVPAEKENLPVAETDPKRIIDVPVYLIDSFPGHPYRVKNDEDMFRLIDSIRENGVITPATVRRKDSGRYELISGHRRKHACEVLGLGTIPCYVVDITDDEATVLMVESNFSRTVILPSEKAFAYKMRLAALKRMPAKPVRPVGADVPAGRMGRTDEQLAATAEDSARQIQRYIRLTNLIPELLRLVDDGRLKMRQAVELSYLDEEAQNTVFSLIEKTRVLPSQDQAAALRKAFELGELTEERAAAIIGNDGKSKKRSKYESLLDQFVDAMIEMGFIIDQSGKHAKIKQVGNERFVRFDSLGEGYSIDDILKRVAYNNHIRYPDIPKQESPMQIFNDEPEKVRNMDYISLHRCYCRALTTTKERPYTNRRMYFLVRQDHSALRLYQDQLHVVTHYKLKGEADVKACVLKIKDDIESLTDTRRGFRNDLKRVERMDEPDRSRLTGKIRYYIEQCSRQLSQLRRDMTTCMEIMEHIDHMRANLMRIEEGRYEGDLVDEAPTYIPPAVREKQQPERKR